MPDRNELDEYGEVAANAAGAERPPRIVVATATANVARSLLRFITPPKMKRFCRGSAWIGATIRALHKFARSIAAICSHNGRMSVNPPTLADIAEEVGVSVSTVSRALRRPELVRRDVADRVRAS